MVEEQPCCQADTGGGENAARGKIGVRQNDRTEKEGKLVQGFLREHGTDLVQHHGAHMPGAQLALQILQHEKYLFRRRRIKNQRTDPRQKRLQTARPAAG